MCARAVDHHDLPGCDLRGITRLDAVVKSMRLPAPDQATGGNRMLKLLHCHRVMIRAWQCGAGDHAPGKNNVLPRGQLRCRPAHHTVLAGTRGAAHKHPQAAHAFKARSAIRWNGWPGAGSTNRHKRSSTKGAVAFSCATGAATACSTRCAVGRARGPLRVK